MNATPKCFRLLSIDFIEVNFFGVVFLFLQEFQKYEEVL
jgi:hypothetical protein